MFSWLGGEKPEAAAARKLYAAVIEAARRPGFYADLKAPDTVEGRFEVLSIHVFLVLRRLKRAGDAERAFSQAFFDAFFRNMDDALRELGVGDLSVGKKIRKMAEAFYGRAGAYEAAISACHGGEDAHGLIDAVARNVYGAEAGDAPLAGALATYILKADRALAEQPAAEFRDGSVVFPALDGAAHDG